MSSKPRKLGLFTMKPTLPVLFLFVICIFAAIDIRAATLTVTTTADTNDGVCDADCSLREAVAAAASGDTVVFSSLFNSPQTITLTLGQITITQNLTINGTGQELVTISGNNASRIFLIYQPSIPLTVNLSGITFRDGNVGSLGPGDADGGAIAVIESTLNILNAAFINNRAFNTQCSCGDGGAIWGSENSSLTLSNLFVTGSFSLGPAIWGYSMVDMRDSTVKQNSSGGVGGGITLNVERCAISDNSGLGGYANRHLTVTDSVVTNNGDGGLSCGDSLATATIERCLISGNHRSPSGGGVISSGITIIKDTKIINNRADGQGGGGIVQDGTLYLINSVVSGNRNTGSIFGIDGGGGIVTYGGNNLFVINSTISGNTAVGNPGVGGGIYALGDEATSGGRVYLVNSTIANNISAGGGGGVRIDANAYGAFSNTIVAGNNSTGTTQEDVSGIILSNGINLIGNTAGSSGWIMNDILNVNSMLGSLADNGGSTLTHALLPGSPAINAGNNSVAIDPQTQLPLTTDQRGFLRFYGGASSTVDIGAYEVQPEITGTITYGNAMGAPTPRFVSGVLLTALGSPNVLATSRADGTYTLGGFGSGAYTVTPSKSGGANGISSFDAGLIAKHVAGLQVLTGNQLVVADVSGNGTLSSFDAGQIARYTVGINGFGSSGNWVFVPASRTYSSVNSTQANEDFSALLMGDVSGNWSPVGSRPSAEGIKDARVESYALANVRASATGGHFATQECEGPVGNMIVTTARMCKAFADVRADAKRDSQNRLRERAASLSGKRTGRPLTEAVPTGAAANSYPIMARKDIQPPATAGGSDRREIDRLIGESLLDYCNRRQVENMAKAKARQRTEEELRKCLPKEGELPSWSDDWVANAWHGGEINIPVEQDQPLTVTDPVDPNVMWRVGVDGGDPLSRIKGIDGCLFKSIDGGAKWERLHHTYMNQWKYVSSLSVTRDASGKTILLAGVMNQSFDVSTDSGIMRSDNGGLTWYGVCDGYAALSVAFDPKNPQNAIAEIVAMPGMDHEKPFATSRVVFSTDGGKHWMTALQNGIPIETNSDSKMRELSARLRRAV